MFDKLKRVGPIVFLISLLAGCSFTEPESPILSPELDGPGSGRQKPIVTRGIKRVDSSESKPDLGLIGTWVAEGSSAEFTIDIQNGFVIFTGMDLEDRERFQIQFINWDESTFRGSFLMPSTRHSTIVNLSVLDANRLRCEYSGDASGEAIWWRK